MVDILLTIIGLLATAFSVASTLPQIRKALITKDTEAVSIRFLVVLIVDFSLWAKYGVGRADIVIIIGNSIGVSLNICMLVLKVKYSRKPFGGRMNCKDYIFIFIFIISLILIF